MCPEVYGKGHISTMGDGYLLIWCKGREWGGGEEDFIPAQLTSLLGDGRLL